MRDFRTLPGCMDNRSHGRKRENLRAPFRDFDCDLDLLDRCYETACKALFSEYSSNLVARSRLIIPLRMLCSICTRPVYATNTRLLVYAVSRGLIASAGFETWRSST